MPGTVVVAALGPVTADAARAKGLEPDVVPRRATAADLAEALARFWESPQASR
jgi:uroporphyrinogen-III synthase